MTTMEIGTRVRRTYEGDEGVVVAAGCCPNEWKWLRDGDTRDSGFTGYVFDNDSDSFVVLSSDGEASESVETLDAFKARVYETFTAAAQRTGVSGVPELLATLGITAPALTGTETRTVKVTVEVPVEVPRNATTAEARDAGQALVTLGEGQIVSRVRGGESEADRY